MDRMLPAGNQMSDSQLVMLFLTVSGGLQDAYTYWMRGEVFANAQTGNIVLMAGYLFGGKWTMAIRYLIPVVAFAFGVLASDQLCGRCRQMRWLHWRQIIVAVEAIMLFASGCLPVSANHLANAMVSFSCAMQVQSFRQVNGCAYASTMCIGNLRSGMAALSTWLRTGDSAMRRKAGQYFQVIVCFALGGGVGTILPVWLGLHTIWVSSVLLMVCFCLMFRRGKRT